MKCMLKEYHNVYPHNKEQICERILKVYNISKRSDVCVYVLFYKFVDRNSLDSDNAFGCLCACFILRVCTL